jgi:hypothetical protein
MGASSHSHVPQTAAVHLFISIKEDKNVQAGKKKDIEPKEHVIQHRVRVCNEKVNKE